MSGLELKLDTSALRHMAESFAAMPAKMRPAIRMAINDTGDRVRTPMKAALVVQTGLKPKVISKAVKTDRATDGKLAYTLSSHGGNIRLEFFAARETASGVSAAPRGQRQIFAHTFLKAGWWPDRVAKPNWHGVVFARTGGTTKTGMHEFQVQRSGVYIPDEMVTGGAAAAFETVSALYLPDRLAHHMGRALSGQS